MAKLINTILIGCVALGYVAAYSGFDLPPGPYCGINNECCRDRRDQCSHRILDTLCYCDEFCSRNRSSPTVTPNDDCCPDYPEVCLGIRPTSPPEPLITPCKMNGKLYLPGQKAQKDCNVCECIVPDPQSKLAEWQCEQDPCIISGEVISAVNNAGRSWRAYNYTEFQGKKLKDGLTYKLGTLPLSPATLHMRPIALDKKVEFPSNFDARSKWPNYISPIVDQGWCGSDWAVSLATIASDRFAIQSNGAENVILSPQMLLSCNRKQQRGCDGGHIDVAWNFARISGLVDEPCFPYSAKVSSCPYKPKGSLLDDGCRPLSPRRTDRYKVGPPVRLQKEDAIMNDIKESGPVMAIMTVYQDFFHYRDGIYRHTPYGDNRLKGLHSVRIVGWGEDGNDKYWIVANSWGPQWGENGYFRIARGENESSIEWFVVTALAQVDQAYQKK